MEEKVGSSFSSENVLGNENQKEDLVPEVKFKEGVCCQFSLFEIKYTEKNLVLDLSFAFRCAFQNVNDFNPLFFIC